MPESPHQHDTGPTDTLARPAAGFPVRGVPGGWVDPWNDADPVAGVLAEQAAVQRALAACREASAASAGAASSDLQGTLQPRGNTVTPVDDVP